MRDNHTVSELGEEKTEESPPLTVPTTVTFILNLTDLAEDQFRVLPYIMHDAAHTAVMVFVHL